ncbi:unannotated protein [freshwater metagenome]|uniref:Unannotated protein n=1 Tax=freshwater metagenome TaxID=449393 RepID=A0A6J6FSI2_9ZZZZ
MTLSRFSKWRHIHSMESAYTFGVAISTVAGKFMIVFHCGVGFHIAFTALQTSTANSSSVPVYDSGEYSNETFVPGTVETKSRHNCAPSVAIFLMPSLSWPKTTRRCKVEVELYK